MAIERNRYGFDGEITFECDQCGEEIHTDEADFQTALNVMKAEGWQSKKVGADWEHICPNCQKEDSDNELEEDFGDE